MKKVFVIEDENSFIELYSEVLPKYGYEIAGWANDGFDAIEKITANPSLDIIIIDYRLPVQDGIETMKKILEVVPDVPMVFISADGSIRNRAILEGAKAFLQKPFSLAQLTNLLDNNAR